jgi:hypothetical protein
MPSTSAPIPDVSSASRTRRLAPGLTIAMLAAGIAMTSVTEEMHQRAKEQKQVRQGA